MNAKKITASDQINLTGIDGVFGVKEHQQGCYHYLRKRRTYGETATKRYSNSVRQPDFYSYQTHQIPQETNPHRKPGKDIRLCLRAVTGQMEPHEENKVIDPNRSYEQESVERALTCANCGQKLHVLEVHVCSDCCAELMSDPNSSMYEEEDDGD
nr:MAG TPA: NinF protein [Caudoviricetes sp.]